MTDEEVVPQCDHNCDPHTHDERIIEHFLDCPVWQAIFRAQRNNR